MKSHKVDYYVVCHKGVCTKHTCFVEFTKVCGNLKGKGESFRSWARLWNMERVEFVK